MQHRIVPGHLIGPYQVEGTIGSGGMGQILRVRRGPKVYAMKVLHANDPESIERFHREAQALVQTEQLPYFARVYNFGMDPIPHIVMEYINAPDLDSWRRQHAIDEDTALALTKKIATGLEAFHELDFVHRDLKPANILIRNDAHGELEPVIIDFGLVSSENFEQLTKTGDLLGTPLTMAPEQWDGGRGGSDKASDIWALGIIHYFLVTGEYLFNGTPAQICQQVSKFDINSVLDSVSESSQGVLLATLRPNVEERVSSASSVFEVSAAERPSRGVPYLKMLIGLLILGIVAGAIGFLKQRAQQQRLRAEQKQKLDQFSSLKDQFYIELEAIYWNFAARELFGAKPSLDSEWQKQIHTRAGEFKQTYISLKELSSGRLALSLCRESEELLETLELCLGLDATWFVPETLSKLEQQQLGLFLRGKMGKVRSSKLKSLNLIGELVRTFQDKKYANCFHNISDFSFPKKAREIRGLIQDRIVLEAWYELLLKGYDNSRLDPRLFQYFSSRRSLQLQFQREVGGRLKKARTNQFEIAMRILLSHGFGLNFSWPVLARAPQQKLLNKWVKEYDQHKSNLKLDGFQQACSAVCLAAVYFGQFGELPGGYAKIELIIAGIFNEIKMISRFPRLVHDMLSLATIQGFTAPVIIASAFSSKYNLLHTELMSRPDDLSAETPIQFAMRSIFEAFVAVYHEKSDIAQVYSGFTTLEGFNETEVLALIDKLMAVDVKLLSPSAKNGYYLVFATLLNRIEDRRLFKEHTKLQDSLGLSPGSIRSLALQMLKRIKPIYALTRLNQLIEMAIAYSDSDLKTALAYQDKTREFIEHYKARYIDNKAPSECQMVANLLVRVAPNPSDINVKRKKTLALKIKILCVSKSRTDWNKALKEVKKFREYDSKIDRLLWWLIKLLAITGDEKAIRGVLNEFDTGQNSDHINTVWKDIRSRVGKYKELWTKSR